MPLEVRQVFMALAEDNSTLRQENLAIASALDTVSSAVEMLITISDKHQSVLTSATDAGMRTQIEKMRTPGVRSEAPSDEH